MPQPFARNHKIRDASWRAVYDLMQEDASICIFGEGAEVKASFDAPAILRDFPARVVTLPISEDGNVNMAVGTALRGVKPIVDIIAADFLYRAMDSICNTAAKLNYVTGGRHTIVLRAETLTGGPTTGQRPEALFTHVPGLRVVVPSTPQDAYNLMATALSTSGVTLFLEDREIDDNEFDDAPLLPGTVSFGLKVRLLNLPEGAKRKMPVVTVLTYGVMRQRVERAVNGWLATWDGDPFVDPYCVIDLLDLRTLYPLDFNYLAYGRYNLERTGKLLIVEPDVVYGGIGAEIAAWVAENMPTVKVKRLGAKRETVSASPAENKRTLPSEKEILDAIASF